MDYLDSAIINFEEAVGRKEYVDYARGNSYAEVDVEHFRDISRLVVNIWEKKYDAKCPTALVIAALYHDFDRVFPPDHSTDLIIRTERRMIDTKNRPDSTYTDDEVKKIIHPQNCAAIFRDYNFDMPIELQNDVSYLIERHEVGADQNQDGSFVQKQDDFTSSYNLNQAADVLYESDGLGFFTLIINSYIKGRSEERVKQKIRFSFEKLSQEGKEIARSINYQSVEYEGETIDVGEIVKSVIK